jgi:5'(3')-deoxyribonucleotidase
MDEVLVDTFARQLAWFRSEYGYEWTKEMFAGKRLADFAAAEHVLAHEAWLHRGEFFEDLPVMSGSQRVVRDLAERFEIFVATAAMDYPASLAPKYRWLARHFPFVPASHYVFCGDKSILAADFLVDDNAYNFERFAGEGILFSAPHNAHVTDYPRVNGWEDVARLFAAMEESTNTHESPRSRRIREKLFV